MAKCHLPDAELLRKLLRYDPETGKLYWLPRTPDMFKPGNQGADALCRGWNACWAGTEALKTKRTSGHLQGNLLGNVHRAHNVIWAIYYGEAPPAIIDHINCDPADNRICNLRAATNSQNRCNAGKTKRNTSGYKGVSWSQDRRLWCAQISVHGKRIPLGRYPTKEAAFAAYCRAVEKYHGEFGRVA